MVMIRPKGKAEKIAKAVLRKKGVKLQEPKQLPPQKIQGPYLLH